MAYYRLYLLSPSGDHFVGFEEIEAPDDVEAVKLAERHRGVHPLELWCGRRKVKAFPAKQVAAGQWADPATGQSPDLAQ